MKVLLMPSSYLPNIGGVEQLVAGLARHLCLAGHSAWVVAPLWPSHLAVEEEIEGIRVNRVVCELPRKNLPLFAYRYLCARGSLRRLVARWRPDIIHVHCLGPNALYATLLARDSGLPLVVTTHGELQGDDTGMHRSPVCRAVHRFAFNRADWVTACSQFSLSSIPYAFRCPRTVIPNAVDIGLIGDDRRDHSKEAYILCAARLTHNKGVDVLLEAYARIHHELPDLWIAGDGAERSMLCDVVKRLGITARVRFLGAVPHRNVVALMADCMFHVCPSRNEAFGIVNLEAMAAGKPVIATAVGGVPEVVGDGETGVLVPGEDVDAMVAAIRRLAGDAGLRERLGTAGLQRVRQFTWPAIAEDYLRVYGRAVDAS